MATGDQGPFDSFDEVCTQTQGPADARTGYKELSHRDLHDLHGKTPNPLPAHVLHKMDEVGSARGLSMKRGRAQKEMAESCEPAMGEQRADKRCRRAVAHLNFVTKKEILKHHAQWREKEMQLFRNTPLDLWDGAIDVVSTAKAADECNRISDRNCLRGRKVSTRKT